MKTALAIRHVHFEDLGAFEPVIGDAGYRVRYVDVDSDAPLRDEPADLLIVLGGPIGACEDGAYPFLRQEIAAIERQMEAGRPTMGVCLGAQLIARVAGARVFAADAKEIGFAPIALSDAGRASCLAPFAQEPMTLHWHGDTFDLPAGATRLASTDICENQAFSMGANVIGFQFHPEARANGFERWLVGHAAELTAAGADIGHLRTEAARLGPQLERKARRVAADWLAQLR